MAAQVARIARIESLVGSMRNGPVEFRDQESVDVIDGENGRPNSHFQSHGNRLPRTFLPAAPTIRDVASRHAATCPGVRTLESSTAGCSRPSDAASAALITSCFSK